MSSSEESSESSDEAVYLDEDERLDEVEQPAEDGWSGIDEIMMLGKDELRDQTLPNWLPPTNQQKSGADEEQKSGSDEDNIGSSLDAALDPAHDWLRKQNDFDSNSDTSQMSIDYSQTGEEYITQEWVHWSVPKTSKLKKTGDPVFKQLEEQVFNDYLPDLERRPNFPSWLKGYNQKTPIGRGSYKEVYKIGDYAVSIEIGRILPNGEDFVRRRKYVKNKIIEAMAPLPASLRKIVFAEDVFAIQLEGYYVALLSKLPKCTKDLSNFRYQDNYPRQKFFEQAPADYVTTQALGIATVLQALHNADMYVIDIKPSNMLLCKHPENGNEQLYLADVEDVIFGTEPSPEWVCTDTYSCEIQKELTNLAADDFLNNRLNPLLRYAFVDWVAFSISMNKFGNSKGQGLNMNQVLFKLIEKTVEVANDILGQKLTVTDIRTGIEEVLQDWRKMSANFLLNWKEERIQCPTPQRNNQAALKL